MTLRAGAVLVFAAAACGGAAPEAAAPKGPAIDAENAEKGAQDLIAEIYQSIGGGDTDGLQTLLTDPLFVLGPRKGDALATRADALVALKAIVDPRGKKKQPIHSANLVVVPSRGGRSAWATDTIEVAGKSFALMVVLSNSDDIWLVDAASMGELVTAKAIRKARKHEAVVPTAQAGVGKGDAAAHVVADKLMKGLATPQLFADDMAAARTDAAYIGPVAEDATQGKALKKFWKKRNRGNVREVPVGEIAAALAPDGRLAWASAAVVRFSDDGDPLPMRVFAIYEKRGDDWKLVALQESLAIDEAGAGAELDKTPASGGKAAPADSKAKSK